MRELLIMVGVGALIVMLGAGIGAMSDANSHPDDAPVSPTCEAWVPYFGDGNSQGPVYRVHRDSLESLVRACLMREPDRTTQPKRPELIKPAV